MDFENKHSFVSNKFFGDTVVISIVIKSEYGTLFLKNTENFKSI